MPDEKRTPRETRPHKDRAHELPIRGRYVALAMEVRRVLGWLPGSGRPFISTRAAEEKTGLTNNTVARLASGERVKETTLRAFAQGMGVDAAPLLRRAGYAPPPSFLEEGDPLLAIGDDLGLASFDAVPLSLDMASAGESLPAPGDGSASVGDALPSGVRAIRVRGDCMEPFYDDGDILLVRPAHYAENGQVVIARLDGEIVSVKVFRNAEASGPFLESAAEPRVRITAEFEILGVVEGYTRLHGRGKASGY